MKLGQRRSALRAEAWPTHDVWLDVPGGTDRLNGDTERVDLAAPGVERLITLPISITILVNARPRQVHQRRVAYPVLESAGALSKTRIRDSRLPALPHDPGMRG